MASKSPVRSHVKSPVRSHVKSPVRSHVKSPVRSNAKRLLIGSNEYIKIRERIELLYCAKILEQQGCLLREVLQRARLF